MRDRFVYGIVIGNVFYSNRMELPLRPLYTNGIYCMDMEADNFKSTIKEANIEDAVRQFKQSSKIDVIYGVSFHDGVIPENPIKYEKIPIAVTDANFDEFEFVAVVRLNKRNKQLWYFVQLLELPQAYVLFDLKERFESKTHNNISDIKGITPAMRIVYSFHCLEKEQEHQKKLLEEPTNYIKAVMGNLGADVVSVSKNRQGFEVIWEMDHHHINTQMDNEFRVIEAGFCVSGYDRTQSMRSVTNVLKDYIQDGNAIYIMRGNDPGYHNDDY